MESCKKVQLVVFSGSSYTSFQLSPSCKLLEKLNMEWSFIRNKYEANDLPIHRMVTDFVMTESAWKYFATASSSELAVSFIMFTSEHFLIWITE